MHDYQGKRRDLRRAYFRGKLQRVFETINPEYSYGWVRWSEYGWRQWLDTYHNAEGDWVYKTTGVSRYMSYGYGNSSGLHRYQNRAQRAKEKHALRRAFIEDDWDNFTLPKPSQDWD